MKTLTFEVKCKYLIVVQHYVETTENPHIWSEILIFYFWQYLITMTWHFPEEQLLEFYNFKTWYIMYLWSYFYVCRVGRANLIELNLKTIQNYFFLKMRIQIESLRGLNLMLSYIGFRNLRPPCIGVRGDFPTYTQNCMAIPIILWDTEQK